jgi:3',5'-nucleoside bisphosphate phosphatase
MLARIRADLHIHTCLSPCGELEMSPRKIVAQVRRLNIDMIGVCDHNSAENAPAVMKAAEGTTLTVLPGMEVCTSEEVHLLALFETAAQARALQELVYDTLRGENDPDVFGLQVVANERDEVEAFQQKLLIGAADIPIDRMVSEIHRLGGLAIASHVDRQSHSIISQLGFVPAGLRFDALEISRHAGAGDLRNLHPTTAGFPLVRNSDAHRLEEIGVGVSEYLLEEPAFGELRKALRGEDGRMVSRL